MGESKYVCDMAGIKLCFDIVSHLAFEYDLSGSSLGLHCNWILVHYNISIQIRIYKFGWE